MRGRSVILCTHRLFEAEKVCDYVAVMEQGSVTAAGTLNELRQQVTPEIRVRFEFQQAPASDLAAQAGNLPGVQSLEVAGPLVWNVRLETIDTVPSLIAFLTAHEAAVLSVIPQRATLEEIYLKLQDQEEQVRL